MPLFERDRSSQGVPPGGRELDASATRGSNADAEDSAAHIADLVHRTAERRARPRPPSPPLSDKTAQHPAMPMTAHRPGVPPSHPVRHRPSRRTMVVSGALAAALIGGALGFSQTLGSDAGPTPPGQHSSAPAGYAVQVTDEITDCSSHSRGQTKSAFENENCVAATRLLATGQVDGRPTLFVVSRIQMPSMEAAATIKLVLDGTGTGNLNDLLREGRTFPGSPVKMASSGYTSIQSDMVVTVAEAGFVDKGRSSNTDPALRAAAAQVAALVSSQG